MTRLTLITITITAITTLKTRRSVADEQCDGRRGATRCRFLLTDQVTRITPITITPITAPKTRRNVSDEQQ